MMYEHYKGGQYRVLHVGLLESSKEEMVVYESLQKNSEFPVGTIWIRPKKEFFEVLESVGKPRFELITTE